MYLSGGIGQAQIDAMRRAANSYTLELEFFQRANPKDEYLVDVTVEIKDGHDNTVLNTTARGPFLFVRLPAGEYSVSVDNHGKKMNRIIKVLSTEHRRVVFEWRS